MTAGTLTLTRIAFPGRPARQALLVALLALIVTAAGMWQVPMEEHEIFVAQTAENMVKTGDYLVPRINGDYRLNKPPVSYWAVAAVARLTGHREIEPWLARVPSVLAAISMALLTLGLGSRLFDRRTGLTAAVMVATCVATFKYGHNARPDMLYAALCTAMLYCWVRAGYLEDVCDGRWMHGFWLLAGLATLTKGPQAPGVLALGLLIHESLRTRRPLRSLHRMRVPTGLLLATALAAPWWWLLRQSVGGATLADSQLAGSLLHLNYEGLTSGYYLLRGPALWLPWTFLVPGAWLLLRRRGADAPAMLLTLVLTAMLVFSLGSQVRHIYLLPWVPAAMLLLAAGINAEKHCRVPLWAVWLTVVAAFGWLLWHLPMTYALPAALLATPLLLASANKLDQYGSHRALVYAGVALSIGLASAGMSPAPWSEERYVEAELAQSLAEQLPRDTTLAVIEREASLYSYYLGRTVVQLDNVTGLCNWLAEARGNTAVVFPRALESDLAAAGLQGQQLSDAGASRFGARRLGPDTRCQQDGL